MDRRARTGIAVAAVALLLTAALALSACGGNGGGGQAASPTPEPTASASDGGILGGLTAIQTYLQQVKPIADQVTETAGELRGAVKGLTVKPGESWTEAAADLDAVAKELGDEAASLAALDPPEALRPVQDAAVSGLRSSQSAVARLSDALDKRAASAATKKSKVEAQVQGMSEQLSRLGQSLTDAIGALLGSPNASPSP